MRKLYEFYTDHIDPDGIQPIHALRTTIGAILAIIVFHSLHWPQAYWVLFSTILILQTYNSPIPKQKWQFLLISGVASVFCTFIASLLCKVPYVLPLFLMTTTFIAVYLNSFSSDVGNAAFFVNVFCLSSGALPVNFIETFQRTSSVFFGFIIAIVVCLLVFPERLSRSIRKIILENFSRLNQFKHALYNRSENEKAISIRRNRLIRGFQLARRIIPSEEVQALEIMTKIEYLYEIILILNDSVSDDPIAKIVHADATEKFKKITHTLEILLKQKGYKR